MTVSKKMGMVLSSAWNQEWYYHLQKKQEWYYHLPESRDDVTISRKTMMSVTVSKNAGMVLLSAGIRSARKQEWYYHFQKSKNGITIFWKTGMMLLSPKKLVWYYCLQESRDDVTIFRKLENGPNQYSWWIYKTVSVNMGGWMVTTFMFWSWDQGSDATLSKKLLLYNPSLGRWFHHEEQLESAWKLYYEMSQDLGVKLGRQNCPEAIDDCYVDIVTRFEV